MQSWFTFELNGTKCRVENVDTHKTLARFLSDRGTWPGGPSFAPTDSWAGGDLVLLATIDAVGRPKYRAVDATLLLMPMVAGQHVWTWEAFCLMAPGHTVVRAMETATLECGPRAMSRLGLLLVEGYYRSDLRRTGQLREQLDGIVSRSANWRAIERVARQIFAKAESMRHEAEQAATASGVGKLIQQGRLDVFDDIFSRYLMAYYPEDGDDLSYVDSAKRRFYRPKTVVELLQLKDRYPDAQLIGGGTGMGQQADKVEWTALISTEDVEDFRTIRRGDDHWEIGAAVTLSSIRETVGRECTALGKLLDRFASRAIRNRATLGGNLATASPNSAIRSDNTLPSPAVIYFPGTGAAMYPVLIEPHRKVTPKKKPALKPPAAAISALISAAGGAPPSLTIVDLPGGTRIDSGGRIFDFVDGKLSVGGRTFSSIEKPVLVVLRDDLSIELVEDLKPELMPLDVIFP